MKPFDTSAVAAAITFLAQGSGMSSMVSVANMAVKEIIKQFEAQLQSHGITPHVVAEENLGSGFGAILHKHIVEHLTAAEEALEDAPLPQRLRSKLVRIKESLVSEPADKFDAHGTKIRLEDLALDLLLELREPKFLHIAPERRSLYEQQEPPFGSNVESIFPDATRDVSAASRCLALDEWTACIFHSMRVIEHGLRAFAERLGVTFPGPMELENWRNIIDKIEQEVRKLEQLPKSHDKSQKTKAYSQAASQFRYFKDAWRNHVSHSREHYDEREAEIVYNHVRDFMQQMVTVMAL